MTATRWLSVISLSLLLSFSTHADNAEFDVSDYTGSVVVLDFWASWCGPCRHSFPWLNAMHDKYADAGLKIIAVNVDAERTDADRFLQKYPADFEVYYDSAGDLASYYKIVGMPSTVIFDREGKIASRHHGFKQKKISSYEQTIRGILLNAPTELAPESAPESQ